MMVNPSSNFPMTVWKEKKRRISIHLIATFFKRSSHALVTSTINSNYIFRIYVSRYNTMSLCQIVRHDVFDLSKCLFAIVFNLYWCIYFPQNNFPHSPFGIRTLSEIDYQLWQRQTAGSNIFHLIRISKVCFYFEV